MELKLWQDGNNLAATSFTTLLQGCGKVADHGIERWYNLAARLPS